ncbi:MAG: hypothetical protein IKU81_01440 [Oscillibacter sp.]|nr:hypothetical protein [Oscillibacter sp.]
MKKIFLLAVTVCLLLSGCGGVKPPVEQETVPPVGEVQSSEPPVVEVIPPVEELPEQTETAGWQEAYAAFLEEKAGEVERLRDFERPDYDPNSVQSEIDAVSGSYTLYDIDKDGTPELLFRCQFGWYTEFYAYRNGQVLLLGGTPSKDAGFYAWPGENAVAYNWGRMGGHFVDRISIVDGALVQETYFEEGMQAPVEEYAPMEEIVPGSSYLWENRTFMEMPALQALTLPVYDYGKDRTEQPIDPVRSAQAREKIEEALSGFGAFYGVSADGFGGDTGWIGLNDYLAPGGATPYAESPLEIAGTTWADYNSDGQTDAMLTLCHSERDPYGGTMQVIFSLEEDGVVYAYCLNYMDAYEIKDTVFVSRYGDASFRVDFDGPESYAYTVIKEET